jgi:hypothetical protein
MYGIPTINLPQNFICGLHDTMYEYFSSFASFIDGMQLEPAGHGGFPTMLGVQEPAEQVNLLSKPLQARL